MSTAIDCPACDARLKLPTAPTPGTVLLCPMCHQAIRVPDADPAPTSVTARPAARPAADLEALRYLPPSADMVFGLDTSSLDRQLVFGWLMQQIAVLGDECPLDHLERETGFRLKDLDHVVVAGKVDLGPDNWA